MSWERACYEDDIERSFGLVFVINIILLSNIEC